VHHQDSLIFENRTLVVSTSATPVCHGRVADLLNGASWARILRAIHILVTLVLGTEFDRLATRCVRVSAHLFCERFQALRDALEPPGVLIVTVSLAYGRLRLVETSDPGRRRIYVEARTHEV